MGRRTTDHFDAEGRRIAPRVEGHVILLHDRDWEDEYGLLPVSKPLPVEEWIAATRREGYSVEWTPQGAIAEGAYRGGRSSRSMTTAPAPTSPCPPRCWTACGN